MAREELVMPTTEETETVECFHCGVPVPCDDAETLDNNSYCYRCYNSRARTCEWCDSEHDRQNMSGHVCDTCAEDTYCCDSCGTRMPSDNTYSDNNGDGCYCESCYEDRDRDSISEPKSCDLIESYSYQPAPKFFSHTSIEPTRYANASERFQGLELELNTKNTQDDAGTISRSFGHHAYLKEDRSIGEGFELVTHPHTHVAVKELLQAAWKPTSGMTGYKSGNCGIHVHVSRSSFTAFQIEKLVVFINDTAHRSFIEAIAQRSSEQWAKFKVKTLGKCADGDRYSAINLNNTATIEFRIFRSSTRIERILKCLEFVDAACAFACWTGAQSLAIGDFDLWLSRHRKDYPALIAFIREKNLTGWLPVTCSHGGGRKCAN